MNKSEDKGRIKILPEPRYVYGDIVFHCISGKKGLVNGVCFRPDGITYAVIWHDHNEKWHYALELSAESLEKKIGVNAK